MVLYGTLLKRFYLAIKRVLVLHCYKPKNPFLVLFRTIFLKSALVTTKVCRIPSLNTQQHIKPWSRWATAAEDHTGCRSCQLRTGNRGYNSHRLTKIGHCTHLLMDTSSRIMHHVTKLKSSQTGFLNMTMSSLYSNGLHSHQISIQ